MAIVPDYYAILGVGSDADIETIRLAYRALAQRHHPDHPDGSTQWMIVLNSAWAVLRDRASREAYDGKRRATPVQARERPAASEPGPLARRRKATEPVSETLSFGRYAGWSLSDLAHHDPDYLAWLAAAPVGRSLAADISRLLHRDGPAKGAPVLRRSSRAGVAA